MKRIVSIIFCISFLVSLNITTVFAEGIDLSNYSIQELLNLRSNIDQEINNRLKNENYVQMVTGRYEIGIDIPEGEYILTLLGSRNGGLAIFANMDDYFTFQQTERVDSAKYSITAIRPNEQTFIKLEKSEVLFVYGEFSIKKSLSYMDIF